MDYVIFVPANAILVQMIRIALNAKLVIIYTRLFAWTVHLIADTAKIKKFALNAMQETL